MKAHNKIELDRAELGGLYIEENLSSNGIGKLPGCGGLTVRARLHEDGIPLHDSRLD